MEELFKPLTTDWITLGYLVEIWYQKNNKKPSLDYVSSIYSSSFLSVVKLLLIYISEVLSDTSVSCSLSLPLANTHLNFSSFYLCLTLHTKVKFGNTVRLPNQYSLATKHTTYNPYWLVEKLVWHQLNVGGACLSKYMIAKKVLMSILILHTGKVAKWTKEIFLKIGLSAQN